MSEASYLKVTVVDQQGQEHVFKSVKKLAVYADFPANAEEKDFQDTFDRGEDVTRQPLPSAPKPTPKPSPQSGGFVKNKGKNPPKPGNLCPECGQKLAQRSGQYGDFLGCTGYRTNGCKYAWTL